MAELFNPFPGLRPFHADEKYLFFGRESHTAEVLQRLRQNRFLAVVGTSGSGKSSLVTAGLLPELHGGTMVRAGSSWEVAVMRPGGDPLTNLANALVQADLYDPQQADVVQEIRATLNRSRLGLVEAVRQSDLPDGTNLLVVVDQFEEIFRFRRSGAVNEAAEATAFVQRLLEACQQASPAIYVVLTMRSDYLGDCSEFPGLAEAINGSEYLIPRMNREQRRSAIEGPVRVGGGVIAPRLLQALLNDVGDNPDQLPILQHALMRTWSRWASDHAQGEPIDLRHYDHAGGIHEALSHHADEIFAQLPDDRHRLVAEKLFKALTEKGADNRGIRRPTRMDQLGLITGASEAEITTVIEAYRQPGVTFLMPGQERDLAPDTVIDISHESLMRVWRHLDGWVADEAQSAQIYRRLAETTQLYAEDQAGLYRDPDLQIALDWCQRTQPNQAWANRYHAGFDQAVAFLEASREAADQARAAVELAQRRELEQAKELAEAQRLRADEQKRAAGKLKLVIVGIAMIAIVALAAFAMALNSQRKARDSKAQAELATQQALGAKQRAEELLVETRYQEAKAWLERSRLLRSRKDHFAAAIMAAKGLGFRGFGAEGQSADFRDTRHPQLLDSAKPEFAELLQFALTASDSSRPVWQATMGDQDSGPARSVAISPDGRILACAGDGKIIRRWDLTTGEALPALQGHLGPVTSVAFSPDGTTLASGSEDKTIILWELATGTLRTTLSKHQGAVRCVAFSPDGTHLASASDDKTIERWDLATSESTGSLAGYQGPVTSVAFSPDGTRLAGGSKDKTIRLWDFLTNKPLKIFRGHVDAVTSVAFSPDGASLASGSDDETTRLWDLATGATLKSLGRHQGGVSSVAFSPDGTSLASGSDRIITLWNLGEEQEFSVLAGHQGAVVSVAFGPDGRTIFSAGDDRAIRLWELANDREITSLSGHSGEIAIAVFSPDGSLLASGGIDCAIRLWDVALARGIRSLLGHQSRINSVAFSPDGTTLASGSDDKTIKLWAIATGAELASIPGHEDAINCVAFSLDGTTLASASSDKTIKLWEVSSGKLLRSLPGHQSKVLTLAFSPDGTTLASGSDDSTIMLWDYASGQASNTLKGHESFITAVAFSPDGSTLASGSDDNTIRFWNVATGQEAWGIHAPVGSLAFSPDGTTLASGSWDKTTKLWELATGMQITSLPSDSGVTSVAFSPDGTAIASASDNKEIKLWSTGLGRLDLATYLSAGWCQLDGSHIEWATPSADSNLEDRGFGFLDPSPDTHLGLFQGGRPTEAKHRALFLSYLNAGNWNSAALMAAKLTDPTSEESARQLVVRERFTRAQSAFDRGLFEHADWHLRQLTPLMKPAETEPMMVALATKLERLTQNYAGGIAPLKARFTNGRWVKEWNDSVLHYKGKDYPGTLSIKSSGDQYTGSFSGLASSELSNFNFLAGGQVLTGTITIGEPDGKQSGSFQLELEAGGNSFTGRYSLGNDPANNPWQGKAQEVDLRAVTVTRAINDVKYLEPGSSDWKPATVGLVLKVGFAIRTGDRSRLELQFADESITRLGSNSVFSFSTGTRHLDLKAGSILLQSPKIRGKTQIRTGAVSAAITG